MKVVGRPRIALRYDRALGIRATVPDNRLLADAEKSDANSEAI
jgi:hypothetical protein